MDKKKRIAMGVGAGVILVLLLILIIVFYFPKKQEDTIKPGDYVELDTSNIETLDDKAVLSENPVMQAPEEVKEMKPVVEAVVAAVTQTDAEAFRNKSAEFLNYAMAYYATMQSEKEQIQIAASDANAVAQVMFAEKINFAERVNATFSKDGDSYIVQKFEQSVLANAYDYEKTESGYCFYVEVMNDTTYRTIATWKVTLAPSENTRFAYRVTELSCLSEGESSYDSKEATGIEVSFAEELLEIAEEKDIQKLADAVKYPITVNGKDIADKESFLALGVDGIFTPELLEALKQTNADNLILSDSSVMLGEGSYNIWYQVKDANIYVIGINN